MNEYPLFISTDKHGPFTLDRARMRATFEDGDGDTHDIACRFEVCPDCGGRGSMVNPAIDGNGLSREDFDEDPDFAEDYMAGVYDITCPFCHGHNVVPVVDRERTSANVVALIEGYYKDLAECRAIEAAERRMGA